MDKQGTHEAKDEKGLIKLKYSELCYIMDTSRDSKLLEVQYEIFLTKLLLTIHFCKSLYQSFLEQPLVM